MHISSFGPFLNRRLSTTFPFQALLGRKDSSCNIARLQHPLWTMNRMLSEPKPNVGNSPQFYAPQTKILEGRTNVSECVFEALFKGVSTRFGLRIVEKCFENTFWKVGSAFQNLCLGWVNLCSPNEDSGRIDKRGHPHFLLTFQGFVYQIEYSHPWKVSRKSGFPLLSIRPESSFGWDEILNESPHWGLNGETTHPDLICKAVFKGVSIGLELRTIEVNRKSGCPLLSFTPKSSFGEPRIQFG